jgi:DNA-binding transcriptional MerR regulator
MLTLRKSSEIAVKNMRNIGFSLSKVYSTLLEWQESVVEATEVSSSGDDVSNDSFSIAEPLPPSEHFFASARRSTRTMTSTLPNSVAIHSSAQLIPVVLSLIDLTLQLSSIREALEEGPKTTREIYRQAREALKLEGERWDTVKKQQEQSKDKALVSLTLQWTVHVANQLWL